MCDYIKKESEIEKEIEAKTETEMEITCIGHSGFLMQLPEYNLIFDYFTDKNNIITPKVFKNKKTCVFVSHSHKDHYNIKIFDWLTQSGNDIDSSSNGNGNIVYILDSGCKVPHINIPENAVIKVREDNNYDIFGGAVGVKTYGSTDEGVSFLVTAGGFTIFHAGDLNDWYWEDESTAEELVQDEENYIRIIKKLAGVRIDAACIPEDPRLGRNAERGIKYFREIVAPKKIIPMHFPGSKGQKYKI